MSEFSDSIGDFDPKVFGFDVAVPGSDKAMVCMEVEALRGICARVAELEKDAERYRWLRDEENWDCDNPSGEPSESRWGDLGELNGDDFDEFIDAAMNQEGE